MSKVDGRKIPHPVRESIRHEAIQKWIAGATVTQLSQEYGTDATCVRRCYKAHGFEGLNTRSIAHSKNAKLSPEQLQQLKTWILIQNLTHFGHDKVLWIAILPLWSSKKSSTSRCILPLLVRW